MKICEQAQENRDLMVFHFVVLQMFISSPQLGLQTCMFARSFLEVSTTCLGLVKALARLHLCTDPSEPLLVACVISTLFSCAGSCIQSNL